MGARMVPVESKKDRLDLAPLSFRGHRDRRGGRGDRQRGRRNKALVGELGVHPCGHGFGVMVGLLGVKQIQKAESQLSMG